MKQLFTLFGIFLIFQSCNRQTEGFELSGNITGGAGKVIYLASSSKTDSVTINSENHFSFIQQLSEPDFYNLYFNRTNPILFFIDSTDKITVNSDTTNFSSNYTVSGSPTSEQIRQLQQGLFGIFSKVQTMYNQNVLKADSSKLDSAKTAFNNESNTLIQNYRQEIFNFIRKNPTSFACLPAIYQAFDSRSPLFNYETDATYYQMIDSALMASKPNSKHTKEFHSQMAEMKQQFGNFKKAPNKIQEGNEAPDFEVPSPQGNLIKLSSFRGNYVLLDFWASWCSPCRQENPAVVAAFNKFQKKGFRVFQVSLDKENNDWIAAIQKDGLGQWKHGSDLQYWNSQPAKLYGVQSIPANFLIDPKGIIVATNLRGSELIDALYKIYKKK